MIKDISNRLMRDFATCLQQQLARGAVRRADRRRGGGERRRRGRGRGSSAGKGKPRPSCSGKAPAEATGGASRPSVRSRAQAAAAQPPAAAAPVKGFSLLLSVALGADRRLGSAAFGRKMTRICIAGATGWTGRALVDGVLAADDLELRSAVARSTAGQDLGEALGREPLGVPVHGARRRGARRRRRR